MKAPLNLIWFAALLPACLAYAATPQPLGNDNRTLTVLAHDYAGLQDGSVYELQTVTATLLSRIGIRLEWIWCSAGRRDERSALCGVQETRGHIVIRIMTGYPGHRMKPLDTLGSAAVGEGYASLYGGTHTVGRYAGSVGKTRIQQDGANLARIQQVRGRGDAPGCPRRHNLPCRGHPGHARARILLAKRAKQISCELHRRKYRILFNAGDRKGSVRQINAWPPRASPKALLSPTCPVVPGAWLESPLTGRALVYPAPALPQFPRGAIEVQRPEPEHTAGSGRSHTTSPRRSPVCRPE